jgi:hypothetical protein
MKHPDELVAKANVVPCDTISATCPQSKELNRCAQKELRVEYVKWQ